jgi:hypothetical protein
MRASPKHLSKKWGLECIVVIHAEWTLLIMPPCFNIKVYSGKRVIGRCAKNVVNPTAIAQQLIFAMWIKDGNP